MLTIITPSINNICADISFNDNEINNTIINNTTSKNKYFIIKNDQQTIKIDENTALCLTKALLTHIRLDEITDTIDTADTEKIKKILEEYLLIKYPSNTDLSDIIARHT